MPPSSRPRQRVQGVGDRHESPIAVVVVLWSRDEVVGHITQWAQGSQDYKYNTTTVGLIATVARVKLLLSSPNWQDLHRWFHNFRISRISEIRMILALSRLTTKG